MVSFYFAAVLSISLPRAYGPLARYAIGDRSRRSQLRAAGANGAAIIVRVKINGKGPYDFVLACKLDLSRMQPPGFGMQGLVGLNFVKSYHVSIDFEENRYGWRSHSLIKDTKGDC